MTGRGRGDSSQVVIPHSKEYQQGHAAARHFFATHPMLRENAGCWWKMDREDLGNVIAKTLAQARTQPQEAR